MADETPKFGSDVLSPEAKAELETKRLDLRTIAEREAWTIGKEPPPLPALLYDGPTFPHDPRDARVFLPAGRVGLLAAAGGVGKTHLFVSLALSLATGEPWLKAFKPAAPGRVLLAVGEETDQEIWRRMYYAAKAMRLSEHQQRQAEARIVALSLCGKPAALVRDGGEPSEFLPALEAELGKHEWTALLLDPASRFMGNEAEKDNAQATRFVEALERLTEAPGNPAVLVAHHTRKADRSGSGSVEATAVRGSSALVDGARWVATLEEQDGGRVLLAHRKNNYGLKAKDRTLKREPGGVLVVADGQGGTPEPEAKPDQPDLYGRA